ncbi:MAG: PLP-dependent aminotransferase family protein [Clostridium sp.]|nr:PLP-dependent aminotransferase family protein [Clostridium sp.]
MELNLNDPGVNRYIQVYNYYKDLILTGKLSPGTKLPSIRRCSMQLQLSKTTVEAAYLLLAAEGYIISRPQSGYYVTDFYASGSPEPWKEEQSGKPGPEIRYDFASAKVDRDSFRFELWRRYIKSALRQDERLLSYGEPQGEWELREALSIYLSRGRNVVCTPDSIVVGAGIQSLLQLLCPMIRKRNPVYFYQTGFRQGRQIFEDYGFEMRQIGKTADAEQRSERISEQMSSGSICYLTPSQMTSWGEVMRISERIDLLKEAAKKDILLIEDDYNSEFRYYSRPTPSLQGLSGGRGVVYLGTFSRLLLPSIRMSYMVLPPELLTLYLERGRYYNQTASKAEQIALCQFIRDGHLESQIRKSRKLYEAKAKRLGEEALRVFGKRVSVHPGEAGFLVLLQLDTSLCSQEIAKRAAAAGVAVRPVEEEKSECGRSRILLSCASMAVEEYEAALKLLHKAVYS